MTGKRMIRSVLVLAVSAALTMGHSVPVAAEDDARPGPSAASVSLRKTVGLDETPGDASADPCSTTSSLQVGSGTPVVYCYEIKNTGNVTLDSHDLVDSELGTLLNDFPYTLVPGASAYLTKETTITDSVINTATWTATDGSATAADSDEATVNVHGTAITLTKTVAIDETPGDSDDPCPTTTTIGADPGTPVVYCYEITNNTGVALTRHDVVDSELGTLLNDFPYTLEPGQSAYFVKETTIPASVTNTATWTSRDDGTYETSDSATATVLTACPGFDGDPRNQVIGTLATDSLTGTGGPDIICALGGDDTIRGFGSADVLMGGSGLDTIRGGNGNDTILGQKGDDEGFGDSGNDTINGGEGEDTLTGGVGGDHLTGDVGNDVLLGQDGPDDLFGNEGEDDLNGGAGVDHCVGGPQLDTIVACET